MSHDIEEIKLLRCFRFTKVSTKMCQKQWTHLLVKLRAEVALQCHLVKLRLECRYWARTVTQKVTSSAEKAVVSFLDCCEEVMKVVKEISWPYFRRWKPCSRQLLAKWREKMALRGLADARLTNRWGYGEGLFAVDTLTLSAIEAECEPGQ